MKILKISKILALFAAMAVLFCRMPVRAAELNTEMEYSITIYDLYGEEEIPVEGAVITVSQVASVSAQGSYCLLEAYQECGVTDMDINSLTLASDINTIISKLETISDPDAWTVQTDETGKAQAKGLPAGLYLITATTFKTEECIYVSTPSLITVPLSEGGQQYDVEVYIKTAKNEIEPEDTETPEPDTETSTPDTETSEPDTETSTPDTEPSTFETELLTPDTESSVPDTETTDSGLKTLITGIIKTGDVVPVPEIILLSVGAVIFLAAVYRSKKGGRNQC